MSKRIIAVLIIGGLVMALAAAVLLLRPTRSNERVAQAPAAAVGGMCQEL
jgi:hypothetical protein